MNKKIISLILATLVCSSVMISCGNKNADTTSSSTESSIESSENTETKDFVPTSPRDVDPNEKFNANTNVYGDSGTESVEKIIDISDLKNKNADSIKTILGEPTKSEDSVNTYEKGNYTFEITYFNSVCGKVKVTSKDEYKYPADGANLLKIFGITPCESDGFNPAYMTWNNKFDTFSINVYADQTKVEDGQVADKFGYMEVILDEQYK